MLKSVVKFMKKRIISCCSMSGIFKIMLLYFLQSIQFSVAGEACVSVYYPDVARPYDAVFKDIISGIEQGSGMRIKRVLLGQTGKDDKIKDQQKDNGCFIVGLGRSGLNAMTDIALPGVVGAVIVQPDGLSMPGISLIPQPKEMFKRLKHFSPAVKTVYVIYNPENNAQIITLATVAAEKMGLSLQAIKSADLKSAFTQYKKLIDSIDIKSSALWLLHDPVTVDKSVILPFILRQAWSKKLIIFSSQAAHAKNGTLFSVYPDNVRLGESLGAMVRDCVNTGCEGKKIDLLKDLLTAVNSRTAARLEIKINLRHDPYVDLTFPRR